MLYFLVLDSEFCIFLFISIFITIKTHIVEQYV
jgi:hypothetical protein